MLPVAVVAPAGDEWSGRERPGRVLVASGRARVVAGTVADRRTEGQP